MKQLAQQIKDSNGDYSSIEGSPLMSPKVLMSNLEDELNNMEKTKTEIKKRLASFEHIKESIFLCARKVNKQMVGMECDCVVPKDDKDAKNDKVGKLNLALYGTREAAGDARGDGASSLVLPLPLLVNNT